MHRSTRFLNLLLVSLVWSAFFTAIAVADVSTEITLSPITINGSLAVDKLPNGDLTLSSVLVNSKEKAQELSLTWGKEQTGWFPMWVLKLESNAPIFTDALQPKQGNGTTFITLFPTEPAAGHVYNSTFSYDPASGAASLWVWDATAERSVYQGLLSLQPLTVPVHSQQSYVSRFIPRGATWGIVDANQDSPSILLPTHRIVRDQVATAGIQVESIGAAKGEFRFLWNNGEHQVNLGSMPAAQGGFMPLSLDELPAGAGPVTMEYVEDGEVLFSELDELRVGHVSLAFGEVQSTSSGLSGSLILDADGVISDFAVRVKAKVKRKVWETTTRKYKEVPYGTYSVVDEDLSLAKEPIRVPISTKDPSLAEPGLWEVEFVIDADQRVDSAVVGTEQFFANFQPPQLDGKQFTIAVLPDTQYYSYENARGGYPDIFMRQAEWIAQEAADQDIALTLQLGDITDSNATNQWEVAQKSMRILDGIVPYVMAIGNHDYQGIAQTRSTGFNSFFPLERYSVAPSFGGVFSPGRFENSYHLYSLGGAKYLVLALEFYPRDEVIAWANDIIESHPDYQVILITHTYTFKDGKPSEIKKYGLSENPNETANTGIELWEKLVRKHENMLLVLSGHHHHDGMPRRVATGDHGNRIYEILMDFQFSSYGGAGWIGLLRVDPSEQTIRVESYSPFLGKYKNNNADGFYVPFIIDLKAGAFTPIR